MKSEWYMPYILCVYSLSNRWCTAVLWIVTELSVYVHKRFEMQRLFVVSTDVPIKLTNRGPRFSAGLITIMRSFVALYWRWLSQWPALVTLPRWVPLLPSIAVLVVYVYSYTLFHCLSTCLCFIMKHLIHLLFLPLKFTHKIRSRTKTVFSFCYSGNGYDERMISANIVQYLIHHHTFPIRFCCWYLVWNYAVISESGI